MLIGIPGVSSLGLILCCFFIYVTFLKYKKEEITSDQLRDMSEIFSIKDDYDY